MSTDLNEPNHRCCEVIAIDPGPKESAILRYNPSHAQPILHAEVLPNRTVLRIVHGHSGRGLCPATLAIEKVCSYGMSVGEEVFETVFWSGRFAEAWGKECLRVPRLEVKLHLCHDSRAKDANIRTALLDRLGPQGTKKAPGVTYGIKSHLWAALALAVTVADRRATP